MRRRILVGKQKWGQNMGKNEQGRFRAAFWVFCLFLVWLLFTGFSFLFGEGNLGEKLYTSDGQRMILETGIFFLWMLFFCGGIPGRRFRLEWKARMAGILAGVFVGTWLHQMFLPLLVSGLWLFSLMIFGDGIRDWAEGGFRKISGTSWGAGTSEISRASETSVGSGTSEISRASETSEVSRASEDFDAPQKAAAAVWRLGAAFLLGSGAWISLVCLLAAFGWGGLQKVRILAAGLAAVSILLCSRRVLREAASLIKGLKRRKNEGGSSGLPAFSCLSGLLLAVILTMLFIQLARMNLMPDYDSLHYGLRSQYLLDAGRGIYEDLGNINLVYTYPKGFEILSFPLAGTATWSYQLCFNLWLTVLVLVFAAGIGAAADGGPNRCLGSAAVCALTPGIMNMSITAKSDTATVVCQLCILGAAAGMLVFPETDWKKKCFFTGLGACFLSFSMKPTSLVFSTVISAACLFFLVLAGIKRKGEETENAAWGRKRPAGSEQHSGSGRNFGKSDRNSNRNSGSWRLISSALLLFCGGAWIGTWVRTLRMTGVPTTSVFTSIWERLGFQVQWPYAFSAIPDQGLSMSPAESLRFLLDRLYGVLAVPGGEDMAHVVIAWGGSLTAISLAAWTLWGRSKGRKNGAGERQENEAEAPIMGLIQMAALWVGLVSLASIYLLWQVDGNYFMLFYVLLALIGPYALERAVRAEEDVGQICRAESTVPQASLAEQKMRLVNPAKRGMPQARTASHKMQRHNPAKQWAVGILAAGFLLFLTLTTLCTNWAGTCGFSPIAWKHKGYFHHQQAVYERKCQEGNQAIWSILSQNPRTRVIAFGEHPQVLWFPCHVQCYYDVTGSGGNVRLVKTLDYFKEFLQFAKTEYIYVQAGWLEPGTRAYDVVRYMIEDGSLADVRWENGNMLARVNLDGSIPAEPEAAAAEFYAVNGQPVGN